ncbi:digestive cysteine proteinase 2 [Manduca sexta]|uniref:Uncharacterized protein n=1 Tax=Manduca sexta TaxID=7130 RepID=A0A921Z8F7_MANSE|nr:digestive cysteine proteinase 2 [Manduca sexta]KAG6452924.1 hypothetical protein O3G_MSEX007859 [Manduca sexta]KAG6452925.1 hypothetical protein O3G_MSEX007859 [Manduca sexta]
MLPFFFALLFFTDVTFGKTLREGDPELSWPERYTVAANRVSLTSGNGEDYRAWKTEESSRIDYNNGAVKSIVKGSTPEFPGGAKYEIHPEANEDASSVIKCNIIDGQSTIILLESILPDVEGFTCAGRDPINDKDSSRFEYRNAEQGIDTRKVVWAVFDDQLQAWIPVRYEEKIFNDVLGYLSKHDVWDFFEFVTGWDDSTFDTDKYGCGVEYTEHTMDSESVTQHLLFIDPENDKHVDHVFNAFKHKHNKEYKDNDEHATRKRIFQDKMRLIRSTNRKNLGYKLAVNQFADRSPEEMKRYQGLLRRPEGKTGNIPFPYTDSHIKAMEPLLPYEYDLRLLGLISWVKNQEDCGSCWSFGTTAAMEGALARRNGGMLLSLSNQALIDCAWPHGARGCDGGSDNAAYEWMMQYGLPTVAEYGPYLNKDGYCRIKNMTMIYPIKGFTDVPPYNVEALKVAIINHGPLSASVHITDSFQLYAGGIFYDASCSSDPAMLNHEVSLVGYGTLNQETFWILKNSWGPTWGVDGYMLISARDNSCGVTTEPTYINL